MGNLKRNYMIRKFFQAIVLSSLSLAVHAQSLQSWTWDSYKMKFKAPDNMVVAKSDATVFEASNNSVVMDIYPRKGENLTYDGMKNSIIAWASKLSLSYNSQNSKGETQPIYIENINGYYGCAIDGSKDGFSASVMLLRDPGNADISFYVWVSYKKEYYHDAVNILKSFAPM
jgi:hypothetical protein